jgi:hypothetical protein
MKKNYLKVEDNPNIVRDPDTKAILSVNVDAEEVYKKQREEKRKMRNMLNEFETVKNDLAEIKSLLSLLINNQKN